MLKIFSEIRSNVRFEKEKDHSIFLWSKNVFYKNLALRVPVKKSMMKNKDVKHKRHNPKMSAVKHYFKNITKSR